MSPRISRSKPLAYMITEGRLSPSNFREHCTKVIASVRRAAEAGIPLVQIREKSLSAADLCELASGAVAAIKGFPTLIIINDRADIAVAAGAAGVHLTTGSITVKTVRKAFGEEFVIGVSVHDKDAVFDAAREGADFAVFGPVFETPGKGAPVGIGELERVAAAAGDFPVLGLGGIDAGNYRDVCRVCAGFAAIRFFCDSENLMSAAEFVKDGK